MKNLIWILLLIGAIDAFGKSDDVVIVRPGFHKNRISDDWKSALQTRMTAYSLDSMSAITRPLSEEEIQWKKLIESKTELWNSFKDSLEIPFGNVHANDTIYILLGYLGLDDAFIWNEQTICLDLTALQKNYGPADNPENNHRIDRIFAHELTHLIHKEWAGKNRLVLKSFRDSILWECLYEGIGMYRSLSEKWWIRDGNIPEVTKQSVSELEPIFTERIIALHTKGSFTRSEREQINKNLSRGPVSKKWGALLVAIWLMKEANGKDENLIAWINAGPQGVLKLAGKYLPDLYRTKISEVR